MFWYIIAMALGSNPPIPPMLLIPALAPKFWLNLPPCAAPKFFG
jgi:hypothetical protein